MSTQIEKSIVEKSLGEQRAALEQATQRIAGLEQQLRDVRTQSIAIHGAVQAFEYLLNLPEPVAEAPAPSNVVQIAP